MADAKKYILHIGTNKTGTTAIQDYLFNNKENLKKEGVIYPSTGIQNFAHHNLARVMIGKPPSEVGLPTDWFQTLKKECEGFETVIISSEVFHTIDDPKRLTKFFPSGKTEIIIYLREHLAYLTSWYQQAVQLRNITSKFSEFVELTYTQLNFMEIIDKWTKVFGKKNVKVRLFERSAFEGGNVVNDIVSLIPSLNMMDIPSHSTSNPSVSGNLLFFKLLVNNFVLDANDYSLAYEISQLTKLDESFKGKIRVEEALSKKIYFRYREDRRLLQKKYGFEMSMNKGFQDGYLYPDMDRLENDFNTIVEHARARDFKIANIISMNSIFN